jgi:DNA recombination protein RmuC
VLVSARKFPGIDATKLDAVSEPPTIDKAPRRLTAPELLDGTLTAPDSDAAPETPAAIAELGDVRTRIASPGE